jgi:hypothetical protein
MTPKNGSCIEDSEAIKCAVFWNCMNKLWIFEVLTITSSPIPTKCKGDIHFRAECQEESTCLNP